MSNLSLLYTKDVYEWSAFSLFLLICCLILLWFMSKSIPLAVYCKKSHFFPIQFFFKRFFFSKSSPPDSHASLTWLECFFTQKVGEKEATMRDLLIRKRNIYIYISFYKQFFRIIVPFWSGWEFLVMQQIWTCHFEK